MSGTTNSGLLYGEYTAVPEQVAVCPECGAQLGTEAIEWDEKTGVPTKAGLVVDCLSDHSLQHKYWQSEWQPIVEKIEKWCGATDI